MKQIYIPNSLHFSAIPTGTDNFMSIFGITSKTHSYTNVRDPKVTRANKYLRRMYRRLEKNALKGRPLRFTKVALILLQKSLAFRLAAINFKWPKWFYKGTGTDAKNLLKTVLKLGTDLATNIDYTRIWIPKREKLYSRPIGSPKVPWRCYLWQWYYITDCWISNNGGRASWQHGGFSKKGPNTFFEQLIKEERHKKPFIYEFDLKGYFNNITHKSIINALNLTKVPFFIVQHMKETLKAQPSEFKLPPLDILQQARDNFGKDTSTGEIYATQSRWDLLRNQEMSDVELYNAMNHPYQPPIRRITVKVHLSDGTSYDKVFEDTNALWEGAAHDWVNNLNQKGIGTPQGVSYSPLLTSMTSSVTVGVDNENLMMYMDDGIITADSRLELEAAIRAFETAAATMGVELASEKSGMVKEDGIWLKDLKIIGFRIDPWMDWVFSKTRSGTEVPMPRPDYVALKEYYAGKEDSLNKQINEFISGQRDFAKEIVENPGKPRVTPDNEEFNAWLMKEIDRTGLDEFINSGMKELGKVPLTSHELMVKEGKAGKALAEIWNPNKGDSRHLISEGLTKTVNKIKANKRSWLANHISEHRLDSLGAGGYIQESISSLSTEMSSSVFEWDSRLQQKKVQSKRAKNLSLESSKVSKTIVKPIYSQAIPIGTEAEKKNRAHSNRVNLLIYKIAVANTEINRLEGRSNK